MRKIVLIEAPSNLGLRPPQPGVEPGVKLFPKVMEAYGLSAGIGIAGKLSVMPPAYSDQADAVTHVRNADKIIAYSKELATVITQQLTAGNFSLVLGGDCSILVGVGLALKKSGNFGLFYLDGHTDYVLPHQSVTEGAAGMDLALVTGYGPEKLTGIDGMKPYIQQPDIFCCGNRDIAEGWYVNEIRQSNIPYYDLFTLRSKGPVTVAHAFLSMTEMKKLDGFWIHFDVDVLNDNIMPCVDSRQQDGLAYGELKELLQPLLASPLCTGINITIFDPTLDEDGRYGKELARQLIAIFAP